MEYVKQVGLEKKIPNSPDSPYLSYVFKLNIVIPNSQVSKLMVVIQSFFSKEVAWTHLTILYPVILDIRWLKCKDKYRSIGSSNHSQKRLMGQIRRSKVKKAVFDQSWRFFSQSGRFGSKADDPILFLKNISYNIPCSIIGGLDDPTFLIIERSSWSGT